MQKDQEYQADAHLGVKSTKKAQIACFLQSFQANPDT
jgi:hypothetical protein